MGRASFYRHFASKDDLVVAVLEDRDLLDAAGRPDASATAAELALLIDGAIVTAVREGTPAAAERARRVAERVLGS